MKIDMEVEPLVRDTLYAVVRRDTAALEESMRAFPEGPATAKGVEIAAAVILFVLLEAFGRKPNSQEIDAVSAKCAEMESWAEPDAEEIRTYIAALVAGQPMAELLPPESVVVLSFLIAGNLLASCHREDEKWWDMLDRAEAAAEAVR
ncbi:MAG: hypothetical protein ACRDT4_17430 [Micromonosporaceae bacterium]